MKSKLGMFITIWVCFILQCTLMNVIAVGSIQPNLLIILCVSTGLIRGRKSGLWTGFFTGLLADLFYGSVFGFYALVYMYVGYFSGYAHQSFYDDDIRVPMVMTACMDFIFNMALYGLAFLLRGRLALGVYLRRIILPEVLYTTLVTFIIYRILRLIFYRIGNPAFRESESIWVIK